MVGAIRKQTILISTSLWCVQCIQPVLGRTGRPLHHYLQEHDFILGEQDDNYTTSIPSAPGSGMRARNVTHMGDESATTSDAGGPPSSSSSSWEPLPHGDEASRPAAVEEPATEGRSMEVDDEQARGPTYTYDEASLRPPDASASATADFLGGHYPLENDHEGEGGSTEEREPKRRRTGLFYYPPSSGSDTPWVSDASVDDEHVKRRRLDRLE